MRRFLVCAGTIAALILTGCAGSSTITKRFIDAGVSSNRATHLEPIVGELRRVSPASKGGAILVAELSEDEAMLVAPLADALTARGVASETALALAAADADKARSLGLDVSETERARHIWAAITAEGEHAVRKETAISSNEELRMVAEELTCFAVEVMVMTGHAPLKSESLAFIETSVPNTRQELDSEHVGQIVDRVLAGDELALADRDIQAAIDRSIRTAQEIVDGEDGNAQAVQDGVDLACGILFKIVPE